MPRQKISRQEFSVKYNTKKQLLEQSRYLLFKSSEKWTDKQKLRAKILFELYPDIKKAYFLTHSLRMMFSKNSLKDVARLSLARWCNKVGETNFKSFNTISATIYEHYEEILSFFNNRSTNASAESFNAKIKAILSPKVCKVQKKINFVVKI